MKFQQEKDELLISCEKKVVCSCSIRRNPSAKLSNLLSLYQNHPLNKVISEDQSLELHVPHGSLLL